VKSEESLSSSFLRNRLPSPRGGLEDMGCHEFAKKVLQFRYCKKCGSTPIANRKEGGTWVLNVSGSRLREEGEREDG
jgi:hypothetical protein